MSLVEADHNKMALLQLVLRELALLIQPRLISNIMLKYKAPLTIALFLLCLIAGTDSAFAQVRSRIYLR
ncbi:hypothetical protein O71_12286 [Pontibacter sp. BAB1700]|nr:hypothetical protein O71_12286 [Pontibacter sp. BAB1700]